MKSIKFFVAALVLVAAVPMFAQTATDNLLVSANVDAVCTITTLPVAFGTYDPASATPLDAAGSLEVTCTRGATGLTVDLAVGANAAGAVTTTRALYDGVGEYLDYDLFTDNARTILFGAGVAIADSTSSTIAQSVPVYGQMPAGQDAAVGLYTDTVLATINY